MLEKDQEKYLLDSLRYWQHELEIVQLIKSKGSIPSGRDLDLEESLLIGIIQTYKEVYNDMRDLEGKNTQFEYLQLFKDKKSEKLRFYVWLPMIVVGEEFKGWQTKAVSVVFAKTLDISEIDDVGTILVDTKIVNIPKKYEIRIVNGYKNYPYIYITSYVKYYKNGNIQQPIERFKNEKIIIRGEENEKGI